MVHIHVEGRDARRSRREKRKETMRGEGRGGKLFIKDRKFREMGQKEGK
jgi:hypothetical protein